MYVCIWLFIYLPIYLLTFLLSLVLCINLVVGIFSPLTAFQIKSTDEYFNFGHFTENHDFLMLSVFYIEIISGSWI